MPDMNSGKLVKMFSTEVHRNGWKEVKQRFNPSELYFALEDVLNYSARAQLTFVTWGVESHQPPDAPIYHVTLNGPGGAEILQTFGGVDGYNRALTLAASLSTKLGCEVIEQ